jgi:hypothetical protein
MGGAAAGEAPAAAAAAPAEPLLPLEGSRDNPFLPRGAVEAEMGVARLRTKYGANWAQLPITLRMGFVPPSVPAARAVAPPAPSAEPAHDMIITSILWTQDGQAMAVYESGPTDRRKSGVVKPGDTVDDWQVVEIWRDHVVVADRETGNQRTVYMTAKKRPPAPKKPAASGSGGRRRTAPPVRQ